MRGYQVEIVSRIVAPIEGGLIECTDRCQKVFFSMDDALIFGRSALGQVEGECLLRIVESRTGIVAWEEAVGG